MSNSPRSAVLLLLAGIDALGPGMFLDSSFREPEMHFFFLKSEIKNHTSLHPPLAIFESNDASSLYLSRKWLSGADRKLE